MYLYVFLDFQIILLVLLQLPEVLLLVSTGTSSGLSGDAVVVVEFAVCIFQI